MKLAHVALSVKNSSLGEMGQHFGEFWGYLLLASSGCSLPCYMTGTAHFVKWVSFHLQVK